MLNALLLPYFHDFQSFAFNFLRVIPVELYSTPLNPPSLPLIHMDRKCS